MKIIKFINILRLTTMTDNKEQKETGGKVFSFSVKPEDKEAKAEIAKLKKHADKTGVNFSHYIIRAIKKLNKELKLDDTGKN